jgi:peptidoglycan/LPS O-acetylase OafA/YrhL
MGPMSEERSPEDVAVPSGRLGGVDAARAVAVLGMVIIHFGPNPIPDTFFGNLYEVPHGRASVLFVLLAGVGVALLASGRSGNGPRWQVRGRLLFRAALLLPLGLWLQGLDHGVLVILQFYAVYFLLAALVLALPDRWLLVAGAFALLCGPVSYFVGETAKPGWFDGYPATLGDPLSSISRDLLLSGAYPLVVWSAPLFVGLWVGRRSLSSPAVRWWLLGIGLAVAVAVPFVSDGLTAALGGPTGGTGPGLSKLVTDEPHSQMPLWMAGSIGSACAALGGALLLVEKLPRVSWPLVATGQLALSVYVGHLLLLDSYVELLRHEALPVAAATVGIFMLLAATTCVLWRAALPRGPLEAALATPWWTVERIARLRTAYGRERQGRGRDVRAPVAATRGSREREDHRTKRATAKSRVRE